MLDAILEEAGAQPLSREFGEARRSLHEFPASSNKTTDWHRAANVVSESPPQ
jgi:hypothetical protein